MGTRSLTVMQDDHGTEIAVLYRQYDGYPTGHGQELADFLKRFTITNGINTDAPHSANGMDCLAAQIITHFKSNNLRQRVLGALDDRQPLGAIIRLVADSEKPCDLCQGSGKRTDMDVPDGCNGCRGRGYVRVPASTEETGNFYLYPAGTRDAGEEYVYTVFRREGVLCLRVQVGAVTYFGLPGTKQKNMPAVFDAPVGEYDGKAVEAQEKLLEDVPNDFLEEKEGKTDV